MYTDDGRRSIPRVRLLWALLLQICYSIPSETKLIEHLDYILPHVTWRQNTTLV